MVLVQPPRHKGPKKTYAVFIRILFSCFILSFTFSCSPGSDEEAKGSQSVSLEKKSTGKGYLGMSLPADFQAFSNTSPWNIPISENPEIDPYSDLMINHLKYRAQKLKGDMTKWTIPIHVIDSKNSPRVDVKSTSKGLNLEIDPDRNNIVEGLPIPEGVWPDPEKDGHMVLVDPKRRKSWEFSRAKQLSDNSWIASRISIWDLDGPGFREAFRGTFWWTYGSMSSGMPLIAGLIRLEEIEAGEIKHAILCATPINLKTRDPDVKAQVCCPPASRTDGRGIGFDFIPEGARLQLDPALDLDSLGLTPPTKVVARAMQKYGMYNGMNAKTFKIFFQNLGSDGGKWNHYNLFDDLKKIPIGRFRVLRCRLVSKLSAERRSPL